MNQVTAAEGNNEVNTDNLEC